MQRYLEGNKATTTFINMIFLPFLTSFFAMKYDLLKGVLNNQINNNFGSAVMKFVNLQLCHYRYYILYNKSCNNV